MKKILFFSAFLTIIIFSTAQAQETNVATEVGIEQTQVGEAGVTPDNFLWGLDRAFEQIRLAFTFRSEAKAKLALEFAQERLAEIDEMINKQKERSAKRAVEAHEKVIEQAEKVIEGAKERAPEEAAEKLAVIEKEVLQNKEKFAALEARTKIKIEIEGVLTEEQKASIENFVSQLSSHQGRLEVKLEAGKAELKARFEAEGREDELEDIEEREGVIEERKEAAQKAIREAEETILKIETFLSNATFSATAAVNISLSATSSTTSSLSAKVAVERLLSNAKIHLQNAKIAFEKGDFGEAWGQANSARRLAHNALEVLERAHARRIESDDLEGDEIEARIYPDGTLVEYEIGDKEGEFKLSVRTKEEIIRAVAERLGISLDRVRAIIRFELKELGEGNVGDDVFCIQVITRAKNIKTGEVKDFPTPCDVPAGWEIIKVNIVDDIIQPVVIYNIVGKAFIGPTCSVVSNVSGSECADKPYAGAVIYVRKSSASGDIVAKVQTDSQGVFRVSKLPADTYILTSGSEGEIRYPLLSPVTIQVFEGRVTEVRLNFDSGIR